VQSHVGASERHTIEGPGRIEEYYRKTIAPEDTVVGHLKFALKFEPLDLGVLVATFLVMNPRELVEWVRAEPTGEFARRAWFLYEHLIGRNLDLPDMTDDQKYVPALDPKRHIVMNGERSRRHRVINNLLGVSDFCPTVRRTRKLNAMMATPLSDEARKLLAGTAPEVLARAVNYLYTKETMSSFEIEGETVHGSRAERFVAALRRSAEVDPSRETDLTALQNLIVDPRFAAKGFRTTQNYVGSVLAGFRNPREFVHFVSPKPQDVRELMAAWAAMCARLYRGPDPVVAAAVASFGFVFIHPFDDGNGRIHRFFIHQMLSRAGFTPPGILFPVSAAIVRDRPGYDRVLESISNAIAPFIEWKLVGVQGELEVQNDTAHLYRYLDMTPLAEFLYDKVADTIRTDLREEIDFVIVYNAAMRSVGERLDMPDRRVSLFVHLCM
jgi:hypothetical protein